MGKKCHKNPRACVCIHTYVHACSRSIVYAYKCLKSKCAYFMHVYTSRAERLPGGVVRGSGGKCPPPPPPGAGLLLKMLVSARTYLNALPSHLRTKGSSYFQENSCNTNKMRNNYRRYSGHF